jgi:TRAP-type C4-dicarboxylate transport system substrate-binding protein
MASRLMKRRYSMRKKGGLKGIVAIFSTFMIGALAWAYIFSPMQAGAAPIKLTYASFSPAGTPPTVQAERWIKEVEKRTAGMVKVDHFPGSTLLQAKNVLDGVISGQADIAYINLSYHPGRFPLLSVVDLPVGFPSAVSASLTLWDLYEKYHPKSLAQVKMLAAFTATPANIMSRVAIRKLEDLKGIELRSTGAGVDVLKLLGATPIAMPMPDTPEALQKGVVKGVFSSLELLKTHNFAAYCSFATITNLQTSSFTVVMNQEKWNSLPKDVQKVMDDLRVEQTEWAGKNFDATDKVGVDWAKEKYNIQVFNLSAQDTAKMLKAMEPIADQWVKEAESAGVQGRGVLRDMEELKAKYSAKYGK